MSIITKHGDKGRTKLILGRDISKADIRIDATGDVDELVCALGVARSFVSDKKIAQNILDLQTELFRFATEIQMGRAKAGWLERTQSSHVDALEKKILLLESKIKLPKSFLIPGTTKASSMLELSRSLARRLERKVVLLSKKGHYKNPSGLMFINRVSDYLFLLARAVEVSLGVPFDPKG